MTESKRLDVLEARVEQLEKYLGLSITPSSRRGAVKKAVIASNPEKLDFSMAERAFVKAHTKGLNGQKKFVLLLAYATKGNVEKRASVVDIERSWNTQTALLGSYNTVYALRAREQDWVNAEKGGLYHLRPSWRNALL